MEVRYKGSTASFLEAEMVKDSEDWLEEEEGEDYDADDWVVIFVLRNCKHNVISSRGTYIQS